MRAHAIAFLATGLVFLALDACYLSLMADAFYRPMLGPLLRAGFDLGAAAAFYLIYVCGMVVFAVQPGLAAARPALALGKGAMLGFVAYSTYDLTNQATLANWPVLLSLVDITWGTVVTGLSSFAGCFIAARVCR